MALGPTRAETFGVAKVFIAQLSLGRDVIAFGRVAEWFKAPVLKFARHRDDAFQFNERVSRH